LSRKCAFRQSEELASSSALRAASSGAPIRAATKARRLLEVSYAKLRLGATTLNCSIIFKLFSM